MRRSNLDKALYLKIGAVAVALIVLIVGGFLLLRKWEENRGRFPEHEFGNSTLEYDGKEYVLKENVETFLVLGLDEFGGETDEDGFRNNKKADFLMLFVIDNDAKSFTAIHINRDTIADVNVLGVAGNKVNTVKTQITLAHTYGNGADVSCTNTANSVSALFKGMKINHYISATMNAVPIMNDLVGGVELEILDDFTSVDPALVKGEKIKLSGEQALSYVRARKDLEDSSNSARMTRQRQYINALYNAMKSSMDADSEFVARASLEVADYIVSDRSVTQLQTLAEKFNQYEFAGVRDIDGELKLGEEFMEFYPDDKAIEELIIELFYSPKE